MPLSLVKKLSPFDRAVMDIFKFLFLSRYFWATLYSMGEILNKTQKSQKMSRFITTRFSFQQISK
jgi:hypothetical protein